MRASWTLQAPPLLTRGSASTKCDNRAKHRPGENCGKNRGPLLPIDRGPAVVIAFKPHSVGTHRLG